MRFRFILFVLIAASVPLAMAFVITADVGVRSEQTLEHRVDTASKALIAKLESDTEKRREWLLRLVALPDIIDLARASAKSDAEPPAEAVARVRAAVNGIFPTNEVPQLIAVVNQAGGQVVVSSGEPKVCKVEKLAPAAAALSGELATTYARFDNEFYRLSAAPVGISDVAIVLGDRMGDSTAVKLREEVSADITFILGGKPIVSTFRDGAMRADTVEAARVSPATHSFGTLDVTLPGGHLLGRIFPIAISNAATRSLARTIPGAGFAVVTLKSDLGWVGNMQAIGFLLGLGIFLLGLVWITAIYGPVYRQARSIEAHLARLRLERGLRLTPKGFSPPFTALAEMLDKVAVEWSKDTSPLPAVRDTPTASQEAPKPIQRPLGELPLTNGAPARKPAPDEGTPASFPFQDDPHVVTGRQQKVAGTPAPAQDPTPAKPFPPPPPPRPAPRAEVKAETPRATLTSPNISTLSSQREVSGPVPLPGGSTISTGIRAAPVKPIEAPKAAPPPRPANRQMDTITDADIPPELLARSQELERELLGGSSIEPGLDAEEEHYKSVFDEFLNARRRCNESNDGLTYDKFSARLKKNREQLMEKYTCRTVRFQVYVKDGKAAVKALPVR
jgi:hypothetical protein